MAVAEQQVWAVRIPQVPITCPSCGHRHHYLNGGYSWPPEGVVHECVKCGGWIDPELSYPTDGRGRSRAANFKGHSKGHSPRPPRRGSRQRRKPSGSS